MSHTSSFGATPQSGTGSQFGTASPFGAPAAFGAAPQANSLTPSAGAKPPKRGRDIELSRRQLIGVGIGVVAIGGLAWVLLGQGGGDPVQSSPFPRSTSSVSASASASLAASAQPRGRRNPFVGAAAGAVVATGAPTAAGAAATTAPVVGTAVAAPAVTRTLTPPPALYVYLVAWSAPTRADFRVNTASALKIAPATFDGVTYVGQSAPGSDGVRCAMVRLATPATSPARKVCPGDVVRLR